jgi:hypothetical protein
MFDVKASLIGAVADSGYGVACSGRASVVRDSVAEFSPRCGELRFMPRKTVARHPIDARRSRAGTENQIRRRSKRADRSSGGPVSQRIPGRAEAGGRFSVGISGASTATNERAPTADAIVGATTASARNISGQLHRSWGVPGGVPQLPQSPLARSRPQQEQQWPGVRSPLAGRLSDISAAFSTGHFPTSQQQASGAAFHNASGIMAQTMPTRSRLRSTVFRALNTSLRFEQRIGLCNRQGCSTLSSLTGV